MNKKREIKLILVILLMAAVPRAIELLNHNYLFGYDQGEHFQAVKKIVLEKDLTLIGTEVGGQGGFFQGPGWYYLLTIPFILTRGDPYGAMILMFLFGLGTVAAAFFLTRKIFGIKAALITSLLIAISPAIIPQSRFVWPPFPISFLTVFLLFFLYRVLQKKEKYLPLVTFTLGIMAHFEIATALTLVVSFLFFSPVLFFKRLASFRSIIFSLIAFVFTQFPLIIFDLRNDFLNTRGIAKLVFNPSSVKIQFFQLLKNNGEVFKGNWIATFPGANWLSPLILLIIFIGAILYLHDKKKSFAEKSFIAYLLLSPLLLFLILTQYKSGIWSWWLLELNIYYCFLLGIILAYLWNKNFWPIIIVSLLLILVSRYIYETVTFYKNDFNDLGGTHKIKGKIQAIDYLYKNAKGLPFNLLIFTPAVYTYDYDYLLWWYGNKKYGYLPGDQKKDIFYLLIEPEPGNLWTYKGWLETVIKTGKILETEKLASGFIIQKRLGGKN